MNNENTTSRSHNRDIDYDYIAEHISSLTRIMVRVYKESTPVSFHDPCGFPVDPAAIYLDDLLQVRQAVSYYVTPYDQFYGIINHEAHTLVLGPTFEMSPPRPRIREFMFELGIRQNYFEQYSSLMLGITHMPLELFLRELCLIYYFLSEKKMTSTNFTLYGSRPGPSPKERKAAGKLPVTGPKPRDFFSNHDTMDFERRMLSCITNGNLDDLNTLFSKRTAGRAGKTADNYLRQTKNIFITTATLVSRAAMAGGLPAEEALSLSDRYIQRCERLNAPEQIRNLQYNMVMDFASLVAEQQKGLHYDRFLRGVTGYVREHLTGNIGVEQMAKDLGVSRSHLSAKFKRETGTTLTDYIQEQKIKKAMDYLKNTEKSILEISTFLGFSSQGYFQNVFKKRTGMTPKEYRER